MKFGSALLLLGLLGIGVPCALAQGPAADPAARDMLLRPAGWIYEWKPGPANSVDPNQRGETGHGEMLFQARGDAIVVAIHNLTLAGWCEHGATVSADGVTFDACYETGITLRYDPADPEYPFKGGGPRHEYRLKAK